MGNLVDYLMRQNEQLHNEIEKLKKHEADDAKRFSEMEQDLRNKADTAMILPLIIISASLIVLRLYDATKAFSFWAFTFMTIGSFVGGFLLWGTYMALHLDFGNPFYVLYFAKKQRIKGIIIMLLLSFALVGIFMWIASKKLN